MEICHMLHAFSLGIYGRPIRNPSIYHDVKIFDSDMIAKVPKTAPTRTRVHLYALPTGLKETIHFEPVLQFNEYCEALILPCVGRLSF